MKYNAKAGGYVSFEVKPFPKSGGELAVTASYLYHGVSA
jgi:hypothetical protein